MPLWATALLTILANGPQFYNEVMTIYNDLRIGLSSDDMAVIDKALETARAGDAAATAAADAALDDASQR